MVKSCTPFRILRAPWIEKSTPYRARNLFLPGLLSRTETSGSTGDSVVDTNYANLEAAYNCYDTLFYRDSWDGAGATIISTVRSANDIMNASWRYWKGSSYSVRVTA